MLPFDDYYMNTFRLLVLSTDFSNHIPDFLIGVVEFNLFTYCRHDVRLASLIVLRALARASLECIWFSRDEFLSNFRNADLRLLIAVLHSSLNHGLRLFDLVEDFGIHFSEMSCNAEVKADVSSAVLNF